MKIRRTEKVSMAIIVAIIILIIFLYIIIILSLFGIINPDINVNQITKKEDSNYESNANDEKKENIKVKINKENKTCQAEDDDNEVDEDNKIYDKSSNNNLVIDLSDKYYFRYGMMKGIKLNKEDIVSKKEIIKMKEDEARMNNCVVYKVIKSNNCNNNSYQYLASKFDYSRDYFVDLYKIDDYCNNDSLSLDSATLMYEKLKLIDIESDNFSVILTLEQKEMLDDIDDYTLMIKESE